MGWGLWEVIRLKPSWMELAPLEKTPEGSLTLAMWAHSEKIAVSEPESKHSPDTESVGTLILDFPIPF